ncbi:hypothetical protein QBC39DRAFT_293813 [Podospora conica]|nr:hypothetical protein QBC39DRAFT_293813 [Schizothecium conicum]
MVGYFQLVALLTTVVGLACQPVLADQKPGVKCPSGYTNLVNGFGTQCDVVDIEGLKGHSASQILYEIIAESPLSNDTFFRNGSHVTCLFQDTSFSLGGSGIGAGPLEIHIPHIKYDGALCLYVDGVPQGGLTLGEIRNLTKAFILEDGCGMCGKITANYLSGNVTQKGHVRVDWATNSVCVDDCIDPSKTENLVPPVTAETNQTGTSEGKKNGAGAMWNGWGTVGTVLLLSAMVAFL